MISGRSTNSSREINIRDSKFQTPDDRSFPGPTHENVNDPHLTSLVPRPPHPAFVACSTKSGFITCCMPRLTSRSVCSHLGLFSPLLSSFPEFSSFFLFSLPCKSDCYWLDRGSLVPRPHPQGERVWLHKPGFL